MLARDVRRLSLCAGSLVLFLYFTFILYNDAPVIPSTSTTRGAAQSNSQDGSWRDRLEEADASAPGPAEKPLDVASDSNNEHIEGAVNAAPDSLLDTSTDSTSDDLEQEQLDPAPAHESSHTGDISGELTDSDLSHGVIESESEEERQDTKSDDESSGPLEGTVSMLQHQDQNAKTHHEIFSLSTPDRGFFQIDFDDVKGMNPNIIPHPELDDTWIVVAQQLMDSPSWRFSEIICDARFENGTLRCIKPPKVLPIAPTAGDGCEGDLDHLQMNLGPHDARVLLGPTSPLVVYGSNSRFTCFGQFVQDFRALRDWKNEIPGAADFRIGTELQRPGSWRAIEKNWFLFWDTENHLFVHYDLFPKRSFAKVNLDGSVTSDLSMFSERQDAACMEATMPLLKSDFESIHQATNSLRITLCDREDADCALKEDNTFIFTIYQHKTFYDFHSVYEPYIMLFRQHSPFDIYAMSRLPLWIHGRNGTSELFYVTSMSWKRRGQCYDGYLDDEMFLSFGIEDRASGGIDIHASDLLLNLELCDNL